MDRNWQLFIMHLSVASRIRFQLAEAERAQRAGDLLEMIRAFVRLSRNE